MGCMAQRVGEEIFARAGHVDIVAGTRQFANLPRMLEEVRSARARVLEQGDAGFAARKATGRSDPRARILALEMDDTVAVDRSDEPSDGNADGGLHAYLTVMRGCDLNCTYGIVPTGRGRVMSYPIEALVAEASHFVDRGARVITLLGQTVNSYGEDSPAPGPGEPRLRGRQGRPSLADLLYRLQDVRELERIRLITLHPSYVTEALAEAIRDCDKVDRFLPLPAQSGSDAVLRAMKRGYTTDLYRRRTDILRAAVPDIELGSDWIVGFPGESDADFDASERFLAEQGFAVNYVFKYDPRPTTHAAEKLTDDVPEDVKKARNQRLLAKSEAIGLVRHGAHVGQSRRAFVESTSDRTEGVLVGRTTHNLLVSFPGDPSLVGRSVDVRIEGATGFGLTGSLSASG
jgi:tRNA-2-methylthio-N6-dimethylallyladenosine synthase